MAKKVIMIAGPNGAGKTTFALEFLPREAAGVVGGWQLLDNSGPEPALLDEGGRL